jgi:transcriptional regulator GlxA family with amidase domain
MTDRLLAVVLFIALCGAFASARHSGHAPAQTTPTATHVHPLTPPANGTINVAFIISQNTEAIDLAGPWEVFQDVMFTSKGAQWHGGDDMVMPFNLYTVSDSMEPLSANGLILIPSYTFETAPKPQVIVIPAQGGRSAAQKAWLLASSKTADVTMSVCTGASMLAAYGLLDHHEATTHHMSLKRLQEQYPAVKFVSGTRYVENEKIATAGGLTSGIDLALHIVERYYGRETAQNTADFLEYGGELWKEPQYAEVREVSANK